MSERERPQEHTVNNIVGQLNILEYCGKAFRLLGTKSATKKAIKDGRLLLNGRTAYTSDFIENGDILKLKGSGIKKIKELNIDIEIVYEDDHFIVVNKPGGIAVNGNRYTTVENALVSKAKKSREEDAFPRPIAAHRIDVPTKGLVILGKTKTCLTALGTAFQKKEIYKEYHAVVHGKLKETGKFQKDIDGKRAETQYKTIKSTPSKVFKHLSLVKLIPITGRTHQLRIHLVQANHLILGDKMYAEGQKTIFGKGLFLCSTRLKFTHPITQEKIDLKLDIPNRFLRVMEREEKRFLKDKENQ